ncbi:MAG: hypothetical protein MUF42_11505 [Cytophagaceae bacterium]|jgi:hypothetical protein|nr:hypothetical protein [Cytophagaceae bacterium]
MESKEIKHLRSKNIYGMLKHEWKLPVSSPEARYLPLQEFGFSEIQVNWLLNTLEGRYQIAISDSLISPKNTLDELVHRIMKLKRS